MKIKCPKCGQKYDGEDEGQYIECASCRCLFLFDSHPRDIFPLSDATELAKQISAAKYSGRISSESADLARLLLNLPPGGEIPGSLSEKINFAVPRGYTVKNGNPWRGKGICITSFDSFCYKRMAELLEEIGAELKKTVSKRCDLLILGDEFSEAQELIEKAQELNVPVVNIEKFAHMISLFPGIEALFAPSNTDWICREAVITGFPPQDKAALIKLLTRFSVTVRESISTETRALIAGPDADPDRMNLASDIGVRIIDIDTLISELNER